MKINNKQNLSPIIGEPLLIVTFDYMIFEEFMICLIPKKFLNILKRIKYVVEYFNEFKVVIGDEIILESSYDLSIIKVDKICITSDDIPHHRNIVERICSFVKQKEINNKIITDLNWYQIHTYMCENSEVYEYL